jgi:Beta protein
MSLNHLFVAMLVTFVPGRNLAGEGPMTAYVPILKAKAGEREALQHLASAPIEVRPLLELVPPPVRTAPNGREDLEGVEDEEESTSDSDDSAEKAADKFDKQLQKLARVLRDEVPSEVVCAIDTAYVDGSSYAGDVWEPLIAVLAEHLVPTQVRPVFRLFDSPERLTRVREVIAEFDDGACLRLGSVDRDVDPQDAAAKLPSVLAELGQAPSRIDLVIDLWAIEDDRDAQRARMAAEGLLKWADQQQWRSVAVASGAFPSTLTHLPADAVSALPRRDAELWRQLRQRRGPDMVDFGDYAIAHPAIGEGRTPLPNLRYASDTHWLVWRQRTPQEAGNERFCLICQQVVASEHFPSPGAELCWGDQQIAVRARDCSAPGNPTKWRAFGTSRHLAVVSDRLARLDEP